MNDIDTQLSQSKKYLKKPFVVLLNTTDPENENTTADAKVVEEEKEGVVTVREDTSKKLEKAETKANVEPLPLKERKPLVEVEVKEEVEDIRPSVDVVDDEDYGPEFEEIEIEDLDEYIK